MEPVCSRESSRAGQHIPIHASLVPLVQTGNIYVNTNPSGASAILDNGYNQPTTPGTFNTVSTGWHNVQVSATIIFHQH